MQLVRTDAYDGASKFALASVTSTSTMLRAKEANRGAHATLRSSMCSDLA